jgi:hypothetical protein
VADVIEPLPPSKLNRADRKRYKKANKKRKAATLPPQHLIRPQEPESIFQKRLAPQLISRLHPDFNQPTSPHDVLFETDDEILFYFSGKHLARVSPFFRDMLGLSLSGSRIRDGKTSTSLAIPLHFTTSPGLDLLFHVLLFEFSPYPVLPTRVLGNNFLAALVNAHECAGRFDIPSFASIVQPFIIPCARSLRLSKPFEAYALALMANDTKLANEICWLTLAYPLDTSPVEVLRVLEQRHSTSLERLRNLHDRIQPAVVVLRYDLEFTSVPGLPGGRGFNLPDCRRFACAITTGYNLDQNEVSTTRRLAMERVMEGLFLDDEVKTGMNTIISRLNTCVICNAALSILLSSLVLNFEDRYKP